MLNVHVLQLVYITGEVPKCSLHIGGGFGRASLPRWLATSWSTQRGLRSERGSFSISPDLSQGGRPANGFYTAGFIDPELAERSDAILQAYLAQMTHRAGSKPNEIAFNSQLLNGSSNGFRPKCLSMAEALDVLGLDPTAGACEIRDAHRRLAAKLAPELSGSCYLTQKINEARDILLKE